MDYRAHLDREDDDIITIDTGSIDSEVNFKILSPVIDDNVVVDILNTDSNDSVEVTRKDSKREKIKDLFRSFSWKNKSKSVISSKQSSENLNPISTGNKFERLPSDQFSFSESLVKSSTDSSPQNSPTKCLTNLYDNSKPMLYLSNNDSSDEKLFSFPSKQENNKIPLDEKSDENPNCTDTILIPSKTRNCADTVKQTTPKRSLSRKFSTFSLRSKPHHSLCPETSFIDLTTASEAFIGTFELTSWRIHEKNCSKLILGRTTEKEKNKSKGPNNNDIFLFVNDSPNIRVDGELDDINDLDKEKLLYYPFTKRAIENYYLFKGNHLLSIEEILISKNTPQFSIYNDYFDSKSPSNELFKNEVDKNRRNELNIKSLRLQQSLEHFNSTKTLHATNNTYQTNKDPVMKINNFFKSLDIDNFVRIMFDNYHLQPYKKWKLWIEVTDKTNSLHKRFSVFTVISEYSQILKTQDHFDTFLNFYVQEKNQQLYILREDELPIFHGKHKIKSYGEYVFVILTEDAKDSWDAIIELLITEKLNSCNINYEVIGVCWRKYDSELHSGFYLTLYVDDRMDFNSRDVDLFLSEIRCLMPNLIKHCFKKCKTSFPGEKHVQILDVV